MSQPVQRLSDARRAELLGFYRDMQRLLPDLAQLMDASGVIEALRIEDYRVLHDCGVFIQDGVFLSAVDSGDEAHPGVVFLSGVFPWIDSGWLDLPVANDPLFAAS